MRVTVTFPPYNQRRYGQRRYGQRRYGKRRYGKPWIAKVTDWQIGKAPTLSFGTLAGSAIEIDAAPTDIVRRGQRDNTGSHTVSQWGIVQADGSR